MDLHSAVESAKLVAAALGGTGGGELFRWLRTRARGKQTAENAAHLLAKSLTEAAMKAAGGQLERLEDEIRDLREELRAQAERHAAEMRAMEARHGEEMGRLAAKHAECEEGQAVLREEIDRLMNGPVASYQPSDLRRPRPSARRKPHA